jgi:Ca-activated chloride channel family protein
VGLARLVGVSTAQAQRPAPGSQEYEQGKMREAAAHLTQRLSATSTDTAYYNAGTALLAAGEFEKARASLDRAARSLDPDLRYRALYNAGVAAIKQSMADSSKRDSLYGKAKSYLQDALSLAPASERAKWNLELVQRRLPPPPPSGGGNKNQPPPPSGGQPPPNPGQNRPNNPPPDLSQAQADQILNSVEREERDTRERRLGKSRASSGGVKDW